MIVSFMDFSTIVPGKHEVVSQVWFDSLVHYGVLTIFAVTQGTKLAGWFSHTMTTLIRVAVLIPP
jgi:hypothetical protein